MGYYGKLDKKIIAINLRKKGYSYSQILKSVNVSKSTLSRWCKNIILTTEQFEKLIKRKLSGSEKGRIIGAKKQQELKKFKFKQIIDQSQKEIGIFNKKRKIYWRHSSILR